jgi:NAD+ kinase
METIKYNWHIICYDSYNLKSKSELQEFLKEENLKKFLEDIKEKIVLVLGWDWTMLRAIRENYKKKLDFLGINFWSKWFLLNDKKFIWKNTDFITRKYPLIACRVKTNTEEIKWIAFNEIVIKETDCKMIDLNIKVNSGQSLDLQWDWLLVSTPAGSTGYNSSLNGLILPHTSNSFIITPKAAWKPKRQTPFIIENNNLINIKNQNRLTPIWIYTDWQEILKVKDEEIDIEIKKSKYEVNLLIAKNYTEIWDNKILEEQWFN